MNDAMQRADEVAACGDAISLTDETVACVGKRSELSATEFVDLYNTLRTGYLACREALRRAQLLTPESVREVCEREGFDWNCDRGDLDVNEWHSVAVSQCVCSDLWNVVSRIDGAIELDRNCVTIGQLEDAVNAAKGAK